MAGIDERTLRMKKGFMPLHNEGKTIPEIAEIFHLSISTVRQHLQEIADENGVTREELLQVIHSPHLMGSREYRPIKKVDTKDLERKFEAANNALGGLMVQIDKQLADSEQRVKEMVK